MIAPDILVYPQANPSNYASTMTATDHNVSEIQPKASIGKPKTLPKKGDKNMDRLEKTNNSCK